MSVKEKITSSTGYSPQKNYIKNKQTTVSIEKQLFNKKTKKQTATNVFMTML